MIYDKPVMVEIKQIIQENENVKTFVLQKPKEFSPEPGQFVMAWIPRIDQKPISVSDSNEKFFSLTVFNRGGPFTKKLFESKPGNKIGIQGPYGNGFKIFGNKIILVAGGYGIAPLNYLSKKAAEKEIDVTVICGARTKAQLLFEEKIAKTGAKIIVCTDDGSCGEKGYTTQQLLKLPLEDYSAVYTCGPEIMMVKVFEQCKNRVKFFASLERRMKCGFGICGSCALDEVGLRVCKDGPVFEDHILEKITEFGKYDRDSSGKKVLL